MLVMQLLGLDSNSLGDIGQIAAIIVSIMAIGKYLEHRQNDKIDVKVNTEISALRQHVINEINTVKECVKNMKSNIDTNVENMKTNFDIQLGYLDRAVQRLQKIDDNARSSHIG